MRAIPLLLCLTACADPLSNGLILADTAFVDALPEGERLGPPTALLAAPVGDAVDLALAVEQATLLDLALEPLVLTSEALRAVPPDVRAAAYRGWGAQPVVGPAGEAWWARAEVTRPEGGPYRWAIEVGLAARGPFVTLAEGAHEASGAGTFHYALRVARPEEEVGALVGTYGVDAEGARELVVLHEPPLGLGEPDRYWQITGEAAIAFTGAFDVTGVALPGAMLAIQALDGGRAEGWVEDGPTRRWFGSCWDQGGDAVWTGGDPALPASGDESACVLPRLLEDELSAATGG